MSKERTFKNQTGEIYRIVKERKKITLKELRKLCKVNYNSVRGSLIRLTNLGLLERVERGTYRLKEEKTK
jgi:predicted transcriptional regulator of viral defense system